MPGMSAVAGRSPACYQEAHTHSVQFLICCKCGKVIEQRNHDVSAALARAAEEMGFAINGQTSRPKVLYHAPMLRHCPRKGELTPASLFQRVANL
jgi:hypothetical protein